MTTPVKCSATLQGLGWDDTATVRCRLNVDHLGHHLAKVEQFEARVGQGPKTYIQKGPATLRVYKNSGKMTKLDCWWFGTYRGYVDKHNELKEFTVTEGEA